MTNKLTRFGRLLSRTLPPPPSGMVRTIPEDGPRSYAARPIDGARNAPELCMLPIDPPAGHFEAPAQRGDWLAQLKVDGIRALYIDRRIVTREGGPLACALHCQPALVRLEAAFGEPMMFDGEYVEDDGFDATIAAMRKGRGNGTLWLFDAAPLEQWRSGRCSQPLASRLAQLKANIGYADSPFVGMLDGFSLNGEELRAKAREMWAEGFEGLVAKDPGSLYDRRRSPAWVRIKETVTHDVPVTDIVWKDGRLKALLVRTPDGPARLAAGWHPAEEAMIAANWDQTGREGGTLLAEIAYQRSTSKKRSIRGARFVRLRHDKQGATR